MSAENQAKSQGTNTGRGERGRACSSAVLGSQTTPTTTDAGRPIPAFWRDQYCKLVALRERLEAQRTEHALTAREPLEKFSMDMADAATDDVDHDLALGELSAEQDAVYEIDEALKRIANGSYGICEVSHKPIPEARLKALPWTRFTQEIEQELEKQSSTSRARLGQLRSVTGLARSIPEEPEAVEESEELPADEALYHSKRFPGASSRTVGRREKSAKLKSNSRKRPGKEQRR
jgi:DnaK suppressor protein